MNLLCLRRFYSRAALPAAAAQESVARNPARRSGQHRCPHERNQRGGPLDVEAHFQLAQQHRVSRFAKTTPTEPASKPSTLNSTLKCALSASACSQRLQHHSLAHRRKRVPAMLEARIISPQRLRTRQKPHYKRNLIDHALNPFQHIGHVDHDTVG